MDRYDLTLSGRILIRGEIEQDCTLSAVEGRVAHLRSTLAGVEGQQAQAVAYLDIVGRVEGSTVRVGPDRLLLTIEAPEAKRARLRQHFALLARMSDHEREEMRGHRRLIPDIREVEVTLAHDIVVAGRTRDLSRSGAAVETKAAVDIGEKVVLGSTRGHVVRLFDGGFAMQFARLLPLERFNPSFRP